MHKRWEKNMLILRSKKEKILWEKNHLNSKTGQKLGWKDIETLSGGTVKCKLNSESCN